jgi:hypothetical protein
MRSGIALAAILLSVQAGAQSVTEAEARILSAFTARADPSVLAEDVKLGPTLQKQFAGAIERGRVYAALSRQIAGNPVRVSALSPVEAALLGGNVAEPLIRLEAGALELLMRYSTERKQVTFVEQLRAPAPQAAPAPPAPEPPPAPQAETSELPPQPPKPSAVMEVPLPAEPPPMLEKAAPVSTVPKPAPKVIDTPKPPSVSSRKPVPVAPAAAASPKPVLKPRGECVIKPVMTEDDLWNCSGPTTPAALERLPAETKTQAAPQPASRAAPADCEIKPVMTDDDLRACGVRR